MPRRMTAHQGDGVQWFEDAELRQDNGVLVAFSTRAGGVSAPPYDTLNLAGHVGDSASCADRNRDRLLEALGLTEMRANLVTAEQVHGQRIQCVTAADAGRGAWVGEGRGPIRATDALVTDQAAVPLMLLFADCVPVVLVDPRGPLISVVHAGWRGALAGLPGTAVHSLADRGSAPGDVLAYLGPHVCARHYEVGNELLTSFVERFGTVAEAEPGHLDLGAAVSADLSLAGVKLENISHLGICTAEATDQFFSYRASAGPTGRHAAVAAILG